MPYTRGEEVSRPFDDVLTEIADLADQGVREVTLLGQNVNAYRGADGAATARSPTSRCCSSTSPRSRASSASATRRRTRRRCRQRLIDAYGTVAQARLAPAPAGAVGLRPRAGGDEARLHGARVQVDRPARCARRGPTSRSPPTSSSASPARPTPISTQTMKLVEDVGFDGAFSFAYSPRPGTPAAELADPVPAAVKQARLERLQSACSTRSTARYSEAMVGTRQRVLVDRARGQGRRRARRRAPTTTASSTSPATRRRRPLRRRHDHRRAAALAARRARRCARRRGRLNARRAVAVQLRLSQLPEPPPCPPSRTAGPRPQSRPEPRRSRCWPPRSAARCATLADARRVGAGTPARSCDAGRGCRQARCRDAPVGRRRPPPGSRPATATAPARRGHAGAGPAAAVRRRHQGREGDPRASSASGRRTRRSGSRSRPSSSTCRSSSRSTSPAASASAASSAA